MNTASLLKIIFYRDIVVAKTFVKALVLAALGSLMLPIPIVVIWKIFSQLQTGAMTSFPIGLIFVAFIAIVAYSVFTVTGSAYAHKAAFSMSTSLSMALIEHVGRIPLHWLASRPNGELKKIMSHDVDQIEHFAAHNMNELLAALILPLVVIPTLFFVNWQLSLLMIVILVGAFYIQFRSLAAFQKNEVLQDYGKIMSELHGDAVEYIQGMPDIKIFNRGEASLTRIQQIIEKFKIIQAKGMKVTLKPWAVFTTSVSMPFALFAVCGAYFYRNHQLPFEDVILFIVLGVVTFIPFKRLIRFSSLLFRAGEGYINVKKLMSAAIEENGDRKSSEILSSDLKIQGLNVFYGEKQVLFDVNFTAKEGTVTAIVGPSGSGKSTLAAAIAGLEQVQSGDILVGGVSLRDFASGEVSKVMSVVYQSPFIFSGTVRENLCLGSENATQEAIEKATAMVQCHQLIEEFPDGYDTKIGAEGTIYLSGGQKQRIALARMAIRGAPVVLLDEATAFADPESEDAMQKGLSSFLADKTVLVIAHRLPSIAKADTILVLENGRIVESGTHETLLAEGTLYSRMWSAYHTARSWTLSTEDLVAPSTNTEKKTQEKI